MDDDGAMSPSWSTLDSDDLSEVTRNSRHTGVVMHDWDTFHDRTVAQGQMPSPVVVMLPDDPVQQDSWRRGVARLGAVRNDHVVAVVRTRVVGRELQVDHDLPPGSRSAREWITPESLLSPGQIVTLGAGLARGLAALHGEGICRAGSLTLDDVIIDREGRPRWRLAYAVPQGQTELADDVASLAAILRELLAERTAPGPLTLALLRAEDEDPRRRPTASSLADSLMASSAAEPLALPSRRDNTPTPRPSTARTTSAPAPSRVSDRRDTSPVSRRRRPSWRIVAIVSITAIAGLGVLRGAAVAANGASSPSSPVSSSPVSSSPAPSEPSSAPVVEVPTDTDQSVGPDPTVDEVWGPAPTPSAAGGGRSPDLPWAAVVAALDVARSQAFSRGDASALARANAAGSPAMEADLATLSGLRAAGLVTRGFALEVVSVSEISSDASSVLLRVVDRRAAYTLVSANGAVQERRPARPESTWLVTLSRGGTPASWRINEVKPG